MKNNFETYLALSNNITPVTIERIVQRNIQSMCLIDSEKQLINKASKVLSSNFLDIINVYFEMFDKAGAEGGEVSMPSVVNIFLQNLKKQVLKHHDNEPVSTGLLFTWIPIVVMLNHSASEINAAELQYSTTYLELEVQNLALKHLNNALNKQASSFNDEGSYPRQRQAYRFKPRSSRMHQRVSESYS